MNLSPKNQPAAAPKSHAGLSQRQAFDMLLSSLITDDDVRAAFVADPVKVMQSYGLQFEPDQIPRDRRLPSKETLAAAREKLRAEGNDPEEDSFFIWFPTPKRG